MTTDRTVAIRVRMPKRIKREPPNYHRVVLAVQPDSVAVWCRDCAWAAGHRDISVACEELLLHVRMIQRSERRVLEADDRG